MPVVCYFLLIALSRCELEKCLTVVVKASISSLFSWTVEIFDLWTKSEVWASVCLARELRRGGHIPGERRAGFGTTAVTNHAGPRRRPIRSESYAYLLPVAGLQPSTNWSRRDIADRRPGRWLSKVWLGNGAADTFCWPRLRERLEVVVGRSPSGGSPIEFNLVSVRRTARVLECKLV